MLYARGISLTHANPNQRVEVLGTVASLRRCARTRVQVLLAEEHILRCLSAPLLDELLVAELRPFVVLDVISGAALRARQRRRSRPVDAESARCADGASRPTNSADTDLTVVTADDINEAARLALPTRRSSTWRSPGGISA